MKLLNTIGWVALAALVLTGAASAQSGYTSVTATVTDVSGNPYAGGRYQITFVYQGAAGNKPLLSGSVFQQQVSGSLDSSGKLAVSLADNNAVTPAPSQWNFQICAAAGNPCFSALLTITGSSQDISTALTAVAPPLHAFSGGTVFGGITATGSIQAQSIEQVRYADQFPGADISAQIAAASAACAPGCEVVIPAGTFIATGTVMWASGIRYVGAGEGKTTVKASATLNAPITECNACSGASVEHLTIDGDWGSNSNPNDGLEITGAASSVDVDRVQIEHTKGNAFAIYGGAHISIRDSEAAFYGSALPTVGSVGFYLDPTAGAISDVRFTGDWAHDGNLGFYTQAAANTISNVAYRGNRATGNANDGFGWFSAGAGAFAAITGIQVIGNLSRCNGWPANGTDFPAACTAGYYQAGATASSSGVGFDFNSPVLAQPQEIGNRAEYNRFEGIANTPQISTTVNTSGTSVSWGAGDKFNANWPVNTPVEIAGSWYYVASVGSNTSLTLTSSAGTQSGVAFVGPTYLGASVVGNWLNSNGNDQTAIGPGIYDQSSDGDSYAGNHCYNNNLQCIEASGSVNISLSGDSSNSDSRDSAAANQGFSLNAVLNADATGIQAVGANESYAAIVSGGHQIRTTTVSPLPVNDQSSGGLIWNFDKAQLHGNLCWSTAGSYCLNGSGAGGGFTLTLPPISGPLFGLSGSIASGDAVKASGTSGVLVDAGGAPALTSQLPLSATTASIGGAALGAGACTTGTVAVTGATTAMAVAVSPAADPGAGFTWEGWVSAAGTVSVRLCNVTAGSLTPTAEAYNVRVIQ